ncbi:hypothetical protein GmHk_09G025088 [Glycine max]|nr:hypothetical protein GmHk_09G025088 [Glycine max]
MESVLVVVYYNGDIISSSEGVSFEYPIGSKVVRISEDMMLDALRKTIMNTIGGLIELNATFGQSPDEVFVLLCKPRKPRSTNEIIVLVHDKYV